MFFYYLLIWVMPLSAHHFWGGGAVASGQVTMFKYLGAVCVACAIAHLSRTQHLPEYFYSWQARLFSVFALLTVISAKLQPPRAIADYDPVTSYISFFLLFLITISLVDSLERLRRALLVSVGSVAYASLYVVREWQQYHNVWQGFRPGGATGDANYFALATMLSVPISFCFLLERRHKWERLFMCVCLGVTLLALTFAASRGGFLGMAAALCYLIWRSKHRVRNFALVSAMVIPVSIALPSSPIARLISPKYGDRVGSDARATAWRCGMQMIQEHPLLGIGVGNFKPRVETYQTSLGSDPLVRTLAHNTYIEIAAELGIPSLFLFLGILVGSFVAAEKARRQALRLNVPLVSHAALSVQSALIGSAVAIFFLTAHYQKVLWFTVFLTMCLRPVLIASVARRRRAREHASLRLRVAVPSLVEAHG